MATARNRNDRFRILFDYQGKRRTLGPGNASAKRLTAR